MRYYTVLLACVIAVSATDFSQIQSDVSAVSADVAALNLAVEQFPSSGGIGSIPQAATVHDAAMILVSSIEKTIDDVTSFGGSGLSSDLESFSSTISDVYVSVSDGLDEVVKKKEGFASLGAVGPALKDLKALSSATNALATALIDKAPADLKPTASVMASSLDAAFATAVAAYSD